MLEHRLAEESRLVAVQGEDPVAMALDVYDTRDGRGAPSTATSSTPKRGRSSQPATPAGTRRVKATAVCWLLWRPRSRGHPHQRFLGRLDVPPPAPPVAGGLVGLAAAAARHDPGVDHGGGAPGALGCCPDGPSRPSC